MQFTEAGFRKHGVRFFALGKVISLQGVMNDGRVKPEEKWRVKALEGTEVVLEPLNEDETVDEDREDFRIVVTKPS